MEKPFLHGKRLRLVIGDITRIPVDVIVNAANSALAGGGGVDGAIHRAGGAAIMRDLDEIRTKTGGCPTGSAVSTSAGELPARWIFHTVGPIHSRGDKAEAELLTSCYRTCLEMAEQRGAASISFPAISTGAYGYPAAEAARIAVKAVKPHLEAENTSLREVIFVVFDRRTYDAYTAALEEDESGVASA